MLPADHRRRTDLHATTLGTAGPHLVLLHGLFGQGKNFTTMAKLLADEARVTMLDLPDHGRSPWSAEVGYPQLADTVAEQLRRLDGPVALLGHSMGGKVAMALALLHPGLVERLCVVDIAPAATGSVGGFDRYVRGMRGIDLGQLSARADAERALEPFTDDAVVRGFLLQNLRREGTDWRWQLNLDLLGDRLETVGGWPDLTGPPWHAAPYLGPVLWVGGARSDYIRPEHAPAMRALFPRVQSMTVKGAGHWVHAEQPAVLAAVLRRFLRLPVRVPAG